MKKLGIVFVTFGFVLILSGLSIIWYHGKISSTSKIVSSEKLSTIEYSKYVSYVHQAAIYFDSYMSSSYPILNVQSMNSKEKTLFVLKKISNYQTKKVSLDQVSKEARRYFIEFDPYLDDIKDSTGTVLYRYKNKQYTYVASEEQFYNFVTKDVSSEGYQDHWILKKKGYYVKSTLDDEHYVNTVYTTFKDYKNNKNVLATFTNTMMALTEEDYTKIQKDLKTVTYYFIKKGKTYYIDNIKVEK